jgi:opacity protein-like surface antigen
MKRVARPGCSGLFLVVVLLGASAPARVWAQGTVGVGPRIAFVTGSGTTPQANNTSTRYMGALLRARTSPRSTIELALDYQSHTNDTLTERVRDIPIQGSLLLYPLRTSISAYVLGGIGWYSQRVETLSNTTVLSSTTTSKIGYHAGLGGELQLGNRAAVHLDYRYNFIHFGAQDGTATSPGAIPIPGLTDLQEKLQLSHEGSMWTTGLTVYF